MTIKEIGSIPQISRNRNTPKITHENEELQKTHNCFINWMKRFGLTLFLTMGVISSIGCGLKSLPAIAVSNLAICYTSLYFLLKYDKVFNFCNTSD